MTIRKWQTVLEKEREEQHESIYKKRRIYSNKRLWSVNYNNSWGYMGMGSYWSSFLYSHIVYMIAGFIKKKHNYLIGSTLPTCVAGHMRIVQQWTQIAICDTLLFNDSDDQTSYFFRPYLILSFHSSVKVGLPVLLLCVNTCDLKVFVTEYFPVNSFASSLILINLLSIGCIVCWILFFFIWCTFNRQRNNYYVTIWIIIYPYFLSMVNWQ